MSPTHTSKTPWKTTAADPEWEELLDYYLNTESYVPDDTLIAEIKSAYLKYAPGTTVNWFRKQASTIEGWRRFLGCLYAGVPVDYVRSFYAFFDRAESSDIHEYHASDIQLAHRLSIPAERIRRGTALRTRKIFQDAAELEGEGIPTAFIYAAMPLANFDAAVVREHWALNVPIEYLSALSSEEQTA